MKSKEADLERERERERERRYEWESRVWPIRSLCRTTASRRLKLLRG